MQIKCKECKKRKIQNKSRYQWNREQTFNREKSRSQNWFSEKINKCNKHLTRLAKKKKKKNCKLPIWEIRKEIPLRIYPYISNLNKIDKFLQKCNLPTPNKERKYNTWIDISVKETEYFNQNLPTKKTLDLDSFASEFLQTFKKFASTFFQTIPILDWLIQRI